VAANIGRPQIVLRIEAQTVGYGEEALTETAEKLAARVIFHQHRLNTLEQEDVAAGVDGYRGSFPKVDSIGKLKKIGLQAIR
jgi:hypothetical protein